MQLVPDPRHNSVSSLEGESPDSMAAGTFRKEFPWEAAVLREERFGRP